MMRNRWLLSLCAVCCLAGVIGEASGAPAPTTQDATVVEEKLVTGELVAVSKRSISVEISRTVTAAEEVLLPIDEKTVLVGPKQLSQLRPGDRVSVAYLQTYRDEPDGKRTVLKSIASKITLVRSGSGEGALLSDDAGGAR